MLLLLIMSSEGYSKRLLPMAKVIRLRFTTTTHCFEITYCVIISINNWEVNGPSIPLFLLFFCFMDWKHFYHLSNSRWNVDCKLSKKKIFSIGTFRSYLFVALEKALKNVHKHLVNCFAKSSSKRKSKRFWNAFDGFIKTSMM